MTSHPAANGRPHAIGGTPAPAHQTALRRIPAPRGGVHSPGLHLLPTMRHLLLLTLLAFPALLSAQGPTGRHFLRDARTPATPAASPLPRTVDAAATTRAVTPLPKLRSGRPWPSYHFGRLPQSEGPATAQPVDASARRTPPKHRGFWRPLP